MRPRLRSQLGLGCSSIPIALAAIGEEGTLGKALALLLRLKGRINKIRLDIAVLSIKIE